MPKRTTNVYTKSLTLPEHWVPLDPAAPINALIHFSICFLMLRFIPAFRNKRCSSVITRLRAIDRQSGNNANLSRPKRYPYSKD